MSYICAPDVVIMSYEIFNATARRIDTRDPHKKKGKTNALALVHTISKFVRARFEFGAI